jgi:outer membrane lipoprotein SlyB
MRRLKPTLVVAFLFTCGCASVSPTQAGHTAGAFIGGVILPGIGMPIGTAVGYLAGLVVEKKIDEDRDKKEKVELSQKLQDPPESSNISSNLSAEYPGRIWIDEQVHEGKLIAGHFEERVIP